MTGVLINAKSVWEYEPEDFRAYVQSLGEYEKTRNDWKAAKSGGKAKNPIPVSVRKNRKGTLIITMRGREPKWITPEEIRVCAKLSGIPEREIWVKVEEKSIVIKRDVLVVGKA